MSIVTHTKQLVSKQINEIAKWNEETNQIGTKILKQRGKAFVQPNIGPPFRWNIIAKPLMCEFMGYYGSHL